MDGDFGGVGLSEEWPVVAVAAFLGCCVVAVLLFLGVCWIGRLAVFAVLEWVRDIRV